MNRPPNRASRDDEEPDRPDPSEVDRSSESLGSASRGGSLPPWSSLGLGPDPVPASDRDWNPLQGTLNDADLPDRPAHPRRQSVILGTVLACGLILLAAGFALLQFSGDDNDDNPTETAFGAAASDDPTSRAAGATPGSGQNGSAAGLGTPARQAAARVEAATSPAGQVASSPSTAGQPSGERATGPIVIAAADVAVDGVAARELAGSLQNVLAESAGDRQVELATATDAASGATVLMSLTEPADDYTAQIVAAEPLAVVTSPRLPLFGVGREQAADLLAGRIGNWRDIGASIDLAVESLAFAEGPAAPVGGTPVASYADYDQLVAGLEERRGGIALVPVSQVDFRVNVLAIDGVDPLRAEGSLDGYPYLRQLFLGVRTSEAAVLTPIIESALRERGLPRAAPGRGGEISTVGFVGDIVPGRGVHAAMDERDDFTHPFRNVAGELASYDLTVANLEGVLSADITPPDDPRTFTFVSEPRMIDGLTLAGIDCLSLANNHSMNSGVEGLVDTMTALNDADLPYVGAGNTLDEARAARIFDVNGVIVAILGINGVTANPNTDLPGVVSSGEAATADAPGTNPFVSDQFLDDIRVAREQADIVIPYFHMGAEYQSIPPDWVIDAARAAIDAGATMVVSNHPHQIQGVEIYNGRPIVYSLGNFIFDQMFSIEVRTGMILEITFRDAEIAALRFHGVTIEDFNQPRLMSDVEQAALMDRLWRLTDALNARR